ncbi:MAG: fructosamine kinase family protein [Desertifilum sp. SIO1I2]|nr:fructosamine kinase family protein [Desertifilum sp. SIO1I2]
MAERIAQATDRPFAIEQTRSVSGGCINQGYSLVGTDRTYFVKLNQASQLAMFEAEALGLTQMAQTQTIRVPQPICWGTADRSAYIVLEWLSFGRGSSSDWEAMGRQLAAMHRATPPDLPQATPFGWLQNNTIGSTPQINDWTADWITFWVKHRLGYQFQLAKRKGGDFPQSDRLLAAIPELLAHYQPQPALVHGDLWSGNAAFTTDGEPVILDPATYVGDREVDMAMTELFGGFPAAFYRGYNETYPLDAEYQQRKTLYNLYHILNHFNLFGGGYGSQANRMIAEILRT